MNTPNKKYAYDLSDLTNSQIKEMFNGTYDIHKHKSLKYYFFENGCWRITNILKKDVLIKNAKELFSGFETNYFIETETVKKISSERDWAKEFKKDKNKILKLDKDKCYYLGDLTVDKLNFIVKHICFSPIDLNSFNPMYILHTGYNWVFFKTLKTKTTVVNANDLFY